MGKKPDIADEEKALFRSMMQGVKPLGQQAKVTPTQSKPQFKRKKPTEEKNPNPLNLHESDYAEEVGGDSLLEFHRDGLQHKVLRNFRLGKYNVEEILDLHGMRVDEAREAVNEFLIECHNHGIKTIMIIHGKGHGKLKPILKNKVNQWLRQIDFVLAFCSASPKEGRTGALYVLLKGK